METVNSCDHGIAWKAKEVLRIAYTLPFVMASVAGIAFAMTMSDQWLLALLIPLDVFFLALLVNFSNDYFDHKSGVDKLRFECLDDEDFMQQMKRLTDGKVYWVGNSLDRGIITDHQGKMLMIAIITSAIIIAIPIIYLSGTISLVLGAVALLLCILYTLPPVNLGARGFGEIDVLLSFFCIAFFSFFVITNYFNLTFFFVSLAIGFGAMLMRIADEVPGYEAHIAMGEKNLVVRFGLQNLPKIEWTLIFLVYLMIAMAAVTDPYFIVLLLSLPLPLKAMKELKINDAVKYWRPLTKFMFMTTSIALLTVIILAIKTLIL